MAAEPTKPTDVAKDYDPFGGMDLKPKATLAEDYDPFGSVGKPKAAEARPMDEYEKKIQSKMPEAQKIAKSLGTFGAVEAGIKETPIVGPIVSEIGTDIGAALPESMGFAEGKTFGERRQDIKAQHEALSRAIEKEHPYVKGAAEVGSSLGLPVGGVAKIVGAGAEAAGAAPVLGRLLGYGTEAGAYGAGTAAAEKAFGTKPEAEKPSVGESALTGATLGLGLGAIGETAAKGVQKFAPDWMKGIASTGDSATDALMTAFQKDAKAGRLNMPLDDFIRMSKSGQPVVIADVGGPEFQRMLAKVSRRNPEAMTELVDQLQDRLAGATERFEDFANKFAGRDLNAATLAKEAEEAAARRNADAWGRIKDPNLGKGTWLPQWENLLNEPIFQQAIKNADNNLADAVGPSFVSPVRSPLSGSIDVLPNLSDRLKSTLQENGINTLRDLKDVKKADLLEMLAVSPTSETMAARNIAKNQTRDLVNEVLGAQSNLPKDRMMINRDNINMQYIDQVRRELMALKDTAFKSPAGTTAGSGRKAEAILDRFMKPLRDPKSANYSPELDRAIRQSAEIFGEKDAAKAGLNFLSKDKNALAQQKIAEAVKTMSPEERKLFRQNVLIDILQRSRDASGSGALNMRFLNRVFAPGSTTAKALESAFGTESYKNLERFVKVEGAFKDSLARLGKARGQQDPSLYDRMRELRIVPTWLMSPTAATMQYAYGILSHHFEKKYAQKLAQKFASPDIAQFQQAMNAINNNPAALNSLMTNVLRGANVVAQQSGQAQGGRIERATGGRIPHLDKAFKSAKKELDGITKPMLHVHDDDIVKTLRELQTRI
mgnify:CR=1 FL=1